MNVVSLRAKYNSLRSKALAAAGEILSESGPESMNLKAIADRAGIGIASMYHYFASKDDLLLSLGVMGFDELKRDILRRLGSAAEPSPMGAGTQAFLDFAAGKPTTLSLMFSERLLAQSVMLRDAEHEAFLAFEACIVADERFPSVHRPTVALALWAMGRGIAGMTSSQPGRVVPTELLESLLAGAGYLINRDASTVRTPKS